MEQFLHNKEFSVQLKVTISGLPKQTADASTQVPLSLGSNDYYGNADINIPGIGSGVVEVDYVIAGQELFDISVSNLPGQTVGSSDVLIDYINGENPSGPINISGIGSGTVLIDPKT